MVQFSAMIAMTPDEDFDDTGLLKSDMYLVETCI